MLSLTRATAGGARGSISTWPPCVAHANRAATRPVTTRPSSGRDRAREGPRVPMATIAADAGVRIRNSLLPALPSREDMLDYLTHTSFERVLANAQDAERGATTAAEALWRFIEAAISQRNELVLPLHGGPPLSSPRTRAVREQVHRTVQQIIDRGRADGTIKRDVTPRDVIVFGSMLPRPARTGPGWDATMPPPLATYRAARAPRPGPRGQTGTRPRGRSPPPAVPAPGARPRARAGG